MLMIFQNPAGSSADDDWWGTRDLNNCCGRMNVKIPSDIAAGDYLLRAEVIALHVAGSSGGAQLYMSCCMSHPPLHYYPHLQVTNHITSRPTRRQRRRFSLPRNSQLPRRLQGHRPRNPHQHPRSHQLLRQPRPRRLRGRKQQSCRLGVLCWR